MTNIIYLPMIYIESEYGLEATVYLCRFCKAGLNIKHQYLSLIVICLKFWCVFVIGGALISYFIFLRQIKYSLYILNHLFHAYKTYISFSILSSF